MKLWWFDVLFLVFTTLKMAGLVDWSWWFVLAPFYVPFTLSLVWTLAKKSSTKNNDPSV